MFTSPDDRSTTISQFGIRSGPLNVYDIECTGTEDNILECNYDQRTSQCSLRDSGVLCTGNNWVILHASERSELLNFWFCAVCADGDVRLTNGSSSREGRVEICFGHQWGSICDKEWDNSDANVVCGQLGFSMTGTVLIENSIYTRGVLQNMTAVLALIFQTF